MRLFLFLILVSFCAGTQAQTNAVPSDTQTVHRDSVIFSKLKFEAFQQYARFENKPYFIMFSASWCAPCHRIKNELFTNSQIVALANENYLAFYMDLEDFDGAEINSKLFKVSQLPSVLFFDPRGKQIDKAIGYFDGYYFFRKLRAHIPPSRWGKDWVGFNEE
jgi:thioredoxin-related protein